MSEGLKRFSQKVMENPFIGAFLVIKEIVLVPVAILLWLFPDWKAAASYRDAMTPFD